MEMEKQMEKSWAILTAFGQRALFLHILDNLSHPGKEDLTFEFFVLNLVLSDLPTLC